jgi:hypothetical protein
VLQLKIRFQGVDRDKTTVFGCLIVDSAVAQPHQIARAIINTVMISYISKPYTIRKNIF